MEEPESRSKRTQILDLEKMSKYGQLSEEGKNWLIQAMDPCHDSEIPVTGYPDMVTTPSIVQAIKQSQQVVCPGAISSGTWDLNVVMWPTMFNAHSAFGPSNPGLGTALRSTMPGVLINTGTVTNQYPVGGITSVACVSGNQTYGTSTNTIYAQGGLSLPTNFLTGEFRIVGVGLEIVNTTSNLNVQGLCTVYKQPVPVRNHTTFGLDFAVTSLPKSWISGIEIPQPPGSLASALLLEGSKQWHAREGCYLVQTLADLDNPPVQAMPMIYSSVNNENQAGYGGAYESMASGQFTQYATTGAYFPKPQIAPPYNMFGAYFTGLSIQTSLTLNWIVYVERFPTPFDNDLVVLTRPSPAFDPVALEMYGLALQRMPAGVMLKENPFGEWFQDLVHNIASAAAPALKGASSINPAFGVVGTFADMLSSATARNQAARKASQQQNRRQRGGRPSATPRPQPPPKPATGGPKRPRRRRAKQPAKAKAFSRSPGGDEYVTTNIND